MNNVFFLRLRPLMAAERIYMRNIVWKMKFIVLAIVVIACAGAVFGASKAYAAEPGNVILEGVYMGGINLSGMTADEAKAAVNEYVNALKQKNVTFGAVDDHFVAVTAGDLGLSWVNESDIDAAAALGKKGNIVQRYKAMQDLKHGNKVYDLELSFDDNAIRTILSEQCAEYDIPAINANIVSENGERVIIDGQQGKCVNVEESLEKTVSYLTTEWDYADASIDLVIDVTEPRGTAEELSKLTDVLGTYTTSYSSSGASRSKNVENGCRLINGTLLYPGDEFSTYDTIKPFTTDNGYYPAGSYLNGKVVDSLGGGICQVSTTLYNAVLLAELEVTERNNHSMIITYVDPSMDAAIAESAGKDFRFTNNLDNPVYIEGHTEDKKITFTIYGVETRPSDRKVRYESEVLSTKQPEYEEIIADGGQGVGYISVQSAHIGYTAQLWKIVEENGTEVSREVINKSTYKASPRSAVVGVNTDNPLYASRIQAAIDSGSIDTCKAEAAAIKGEMDAAAQQQADIDAYNQALLEQQAALEAYNQALLQQQLLEQQQQNGQ